MRNDANDELDHVPSLTTERRERDVFDDDLPEPPRTPGRGPGRGARGRSAATGPLWALVAALTIALSGLGWWSFRQISLMEQQLVATQESFARISEDAAGRIKDISGKVVATESSVTSGSEALRLQVRQLEGRLAELGKQYQALGNRQGEQDKRLEQLAADLKSQQGDSGKAGDALKGVVDAQTALKSELASLKSAQGDGDKLASQLKSLSGEVATLQKAGDPNQAIARLEQELLVLKSDLETRPAPAQGGNTAEFDAFRAQTTRSISTLQSQIQNLQQQIDAR